MRGGFEPRMNDSMTEWRQVHVKLVVDEEEMGFVLLVTYRSAVHKSEPWPKGR